jgi:AAA15 family ATPase/GTPase
MIKNITIKNYRGFENLVIPSLAHVNLIVGRNSSGKSSLLEALQIFLSTSKQTAIRTILRSRNEYRRNASDEEEDEIDLDSIFFQPTSPESRDFMPEVNIFEEGQPSSSLKIYRGYASTVTSEDGTTKRNIIKDSSSPGSSEMLTDVY